MPRPAQRPKKGMVIKVSNKPYSKKPSGIAKWLRMATPLDLVLVGGIALAAVAVVVIGFAVLQKGKAKPTNGSSIAVSASTSAAVADKEYNKDALILEEEDYVDTILPEVADAGTAYVDETLFIGDSNTVRMMSYGHTTLKNDVAAESMGIQHVPSKAIVFFQGYDEPVTVPKAVSLIQPKRVIITYGTNNTIGWSAKTLVDEYEKAISAILKAYPYTDIIINAVPPIDKLRENTAITMQTIDSFNKALAEMAKAKGYKFLNSAEALKDEKTGFAKTDYTISDGIHLSKKGMDALFKYVRTHTFIAEDRRPKPLKPVPARKETPPGIITEDPLAVRGEKKDGVSIVFQNATPDMGVFEGNSKQTVKSGNACESVTAVAREGFVFMGWSCTEGRIDDVANPVLKFTVPPTGAKEIVITASFGPAGLWFINDKGEGVTALSLEPTKQVQLRAAFKPATYSGNKALTFTTSNPAVAIVDANGLVTAVAAGDATITCTAASGKLSASVNITVSAAKKPLTDFAISASSVSIEVGKPDVQLSITGYTPADTTTVKTPAFSSSNSAVATVNETGIIHAVAKGSATITVTVGGISKTCAVTVTEPIVKDKFCDVANCTAKGPYTQAELDAHNANPGAAHPAVNPKDKTCDHPGCTAPGPYTQAELDAHKANPGAAHPPVDPKDKTCDHPGCTAPGPYTQAELDAHKANPGAAHPAPPPSFICNVCSPAVPFASQAELDAHNTATHPAP